MSPVPLFDRTKPYQQVPFQYSLHSIEEEGGECLHREFLAKPGVDPQEEIAEKLLCEIPSHACILAYNMSFEKRVLKSFQVLLPEKATSIQILIDNMRDLMEPFRKRDVYYWEFEGSYSIKDVLPVLVPDFSYEGMKIVNGGMAMEAYHRMSALEDPAELKKLRDNLLEYCKLDTFAMMKILEKIKTLV